VDRETVQQLAVSVRVQLDDREVERLAAQLTAILEQLSVLRDVVYATSPATSGSESGSDAALLPGCSHDPASTQPLRGDEPGADAMVGTLSRFAPALRDGFFVVPRLPSHGGSTP
jgi:aspartyl-tRNA(Asn)/glutamyl-tRNA(Gln) amidotransferase subunit C